MNVTLISGHQTEVHGIPFTSSPSVHLTHPVNPTGKMAPGIISFLQVLLITYLSTFFSIPNQNSDDRLILLDRSYDLLVNSFNKHLLNIHHVEV